MRHFRHALEGRLGLVDGLLGIDRQIGVVVSVLISGFAFAGHRHLW